MFMFLSIAVINSKLIISHPPRFLNITSLNYVSTEGRIKKKKGHWLYMQPELHSDLALLFTSCITLGNLLNFPQAWLLFLFIEDMSLEGLLWKST